MVTAHLCLPAEWGPHEATWIAWPHNTSDWPGKFHPIPWVYAEIARKITHGEMLRVLVNSKQDKARAISVLRRAGVDLSRIEFFFFPTNRGWTRDFGPIFVSRFTPGEAPGSAIVHCQFNAWAKYSDWQLDNTVSRQVAAALGLRLVEAKVKAQGFVLEGGAMDVNGAGDLLTTEECLLDRSTQARNPRLSLGEVEGALRSFFGATHVLWLGRGIAGDDTHGHIDDFCRFTGPRTVVLCREDDVKDENYRPLQENRERLEGMRLADDSKIEVVPLPMPSPVYFDRQRLPASYANFYISNAEVLVPTFNDPHDREALGILSEMFPGRTVAGIHALDLVWGLGTIHCLTQQQPLAPSPAPG